ncbi:Stress responsive A/B Barrel Domain protein [Planctomycetes bacterium Poly30]|uniref:Stress responsive A/B Barrel Domain protein n=1 Tax=Saltatorellus ferox TaxID=2528018 RepID=A0A518F043_9BACT|nr:Stress responsive A/B Barrel Domain protein [Planctomycetes bacterium Poly30]
MESKNPGSARLAHSVFFTLTDASDSACEALMAAAGKFLDGHDGCVSFAVGRRAEQYAREVNDATFHVALNMVFDSVAAHDAYQVAPRHLEFIESQKGNWSEVRVFDSFA